MDSGEKHVFRRNADFEICKISKSLCSKPGSGTSQQNPTQKGEPAATGRQSVFFICKSKEPRFEFDEEAQETNFCPDWIPVSYADHTSPVFPATLFPALFSRLARYSTQKQ
ncbi:MAG: hypothetical protein ACLU98_00635 [Desulfovibrio fairfieldensis]